MLQTNIPVGDKLTALIYNTRPGEIWVQAYELNSPENIPLPKEEICQHEEPCIEVHGHVSLVLRERGKIVAGSHREGHNIWTLTGREYDAQLKSYKSYGPDTPYRNDRIKYMGFGSGTQPEVSGITRLITPIAFDAGNNFLAAVGAPPTFPLTPVRTTVRYTKIYQEMELSVAGTVTLQEAGLFTDGGPPNFTPGSRDITLANAGSQAPMAYKTFEPLKKTQNFVLEARWDLRHN